MDMGGSCDPFVVVRVGDGQLASRTRQTAFAKATLAPTWNEKFEIELSEDEAEGEGEDKVWVQVWDWDQYGSNEMVGECAIYLSTVAKRNSSSPKWYSIYGFRDDTETGIGKVGQVYLSLKIQPPSPPSETRCLEALVARGKDLRAMDSNGSSDPYVTIELPGRKGSCRRTAVVKRSLNPAWEERFSWILEEEDRELLVQAWDRDFLSSDDLIGSCTINLSSLDHTCVQQPAGPEASAEGDDIVWHTLRDSSGADAGQVSIGLKVRPLPTDSQSSGVARLGAEAMDATGWSLKIKAQSGRALKAMDRGGTSDPYMVFFVGKQASVGARTKRCQTKVVKKTCNPEWRESLVIDGLREVEVESEFVTGVCDCLPATA